MLGLLEAGSVALILAFLLLSQQTGSLSFSDFAAAAGAMPKAEQLFVGLLLLIDSAPSLDCYLSMSGFLAPMVPAAEPQALCCPCRLERAFFGSVAD